MIKWNMKGTLPKKFMLALMLLVVSSVISIGVNYKSMGVFRFVHKKVPIYSVDTKEKKISLTFDISWGEDTTLKLLDILDKYNVKATFFLVGGWIDDNGELVKEMVKRGHELGNHTNKHPNMSSISKERLIEEIMLCDSKIMSLTGKGTKLFRCPAGEYNDVVLDTVQSLGRYTIQWDADSIDWKEHGPNIEYNRIIKKAKPGSILLFHNTAKYTPETLPQVIEKLQKDGYSFVKVSDLIYKDNYYIDAEGKQFEK
jgi:peptidoglycan-N-acetylglucosamine deacetylase